MRHRRSNDLAKVVTESRLRAAAGKRAYERGLRYFEAGVVTDLVVTDDTIHARVEGRAEYAVQLWAQGKTLGYRCSCPVGDSGELCKHGVAAGLAWLAGRRIALASRNGTDDLASIRAWLDGASHAQLVDLLLEQVILDDVLRGNLEMRAARASAASGVDSKALKEIVRKALYIGRFVDYRGMRGYLQRALPAVDLIAGLLDDGRPAAAVELAHYAFKHGIASYVRMDDSSGHFGDLLRDIAALHLRACRDAKPEPAALGKQLFDLMRRDDWGLIGFDDYLSLLGETGLRAFRKLAEKQWKNVPVRGPEQQHERAFGEYFIITQIMEALARHDGDIDALVEIKRRDLTGAHQFLTIAELLAEADRRDEALDWAERGLAAFSERLDGRLVDFLVDEYGRRGRHDEAAGLVWREFNQKPMLATYRKLKSATERAGTWESWRGKALDWLRSDYVKQREQKRWMWSPGGRSLLVEIFLWEGDSDSALAEARAGGCTEALWFDLAEARERNHPREAIAIYQARIDDIVDRRNNEAYDQAAELVAKIRGLMYRVRQRKAFDEWLEAVRGRHRAKRNFMKRINETMATAGMDR